MSDNLRLYRVEYRLPGGPPEVEDGDLVHLDRCRESAEQVAEMYRADGYEARVVEYDVTRSEPQGPERMTVRNFRGEVIGHLAGFGAHVVDDFTHDLEITQPEATRRVDRADAEMGRVMREERPAAGPWIPASDPPMCSTLAVVLRSHGNFKGYTVAVWAHAARTWHTETGILTDVTHWAEITPPKETT